MNKNLENLLDEFKQGLTKSEYDSYMPILRNSFMPYLEKMYQKELDNSVAEFFETMISSQDIVGAGINYIDNTPKVKNESAIDKYLTATSEFFKAVIFPKWQRCQLSTVDNFKGYYQKIFTGKNKTLKKHEARTHLEEDSVKKLLECLYELDDSSFKNIMLKATIPLILLYGFKIGTIADIKREDYEGDTRIIKIKLEADTVNLELPYNVYFYVDEVFQRKTDDEYLFNIAKGQKLISDYFDDFLVKYNKKMNKETKITLDGLARYAVINMFLEGMNPIVIRQITGMKDINLNYCQKEAWKTSKNKIQLNRYVNSKIRGVHIYDDLYLGKVINKGME